MPRIELKFKLDQHQYEFFSERIRLWAEVDAHVQGDRRYPVLSTYYDTPDMRFFYQKIEGEYAHCKIRLRTYSENYVDGDRVFIEAKLKDNFAQSKLRVPVIYSDQMLDPLAWYEIQGNMIDELVEKVDLSQILPVCKVFYWREPYEVETEGQRIRVNFDHGLSFIGNEDLGMSASQFHSDEILLEVKTNATELASSFVQELKLMGVDQIRFSKYASAIQQFDQNFNFKEIVL